MGTVALRSARLIGKVVKVFAFAACTGGCASIAGGPARLYSVQDEVAFIRTQVPPVDFGIVGSSVEARNAYIAARMYAIDINYTSYEAALTQERQGLGFASTAATIGLATASTLATHTATKDVLTGAAGAITGARAAYNDEILLAHSLQWIQTQMRTQRTLVSERILRNMKTSTIDYPLAAALRDLEDYYRAGTLTGGVLGTTQTLGAEATSVEDLKAQRLEGAFAQTATAEAITACRRRVGTDRLLSLMTVRSRRNLAAMEAGLLPVAAEDLLRKAANSGVC